MVGLQLDHSTRWGTLGLFPKSSELPFLHQKKKTKKNKTGTLMAFRSPRSVFEENSTPCFGLSVLLSQLI